MDAFMSSDVMIRDGYLRFNSLRKTDEGSYRCYAKNNVGDHDQILQVYVRGTTEAPIEEVYISPDVYRGHPGDEITLTCATQPAGRVTWSKAGAVELPRNAYVSGDVLSIQYSTVDDSGRYVCNSQFPSGNVRSAHADVTIQQTSHQEAPKIKSLERKYSVVQGTDFTLSCEATGLPYPVTVWSIVSS